MSAPQHPSPSNPAAAVPSRSAYDEDYFAHHCGPIPYDRSHPHWAAFFGAIADRIVAAIGPRTVLDVGCAKGFLVEALRDRGVEAFGLDTSEYAIGEVRADIRPFCRVASAAEPFDRDYDLIVCLEVLEHLPEAVGQRAIINMCRSTADVLFSSSPDDHEEPTHVNVQPRSFWITQFAVHSLAVDAGFDASFIAPHALRFRRDPHAPSPLELLLAHRDRMLARQTVLRATSVDQDRLLAELSALREGHADHRRLLAELHATSVGLRADLASLRDERQEDRAFIASLRAAALEREALVAELTARSAHLAEELRGKDRLIATLQETAEQRTRELSTLRTDVAVRQRALEDTQHSLTTLRANAAETDRSRHHLQAYLTLIESTIGWRVLEHLRSFRNSVLPAGSRRWQAYGRLRPGLERLLRLGASQPAPVPPSDPPAGGYDLWVQRHTPTPQDVASMTRELDTFAYLPIISIVTPSHDTADTYLRSMADSVRAQIYPHWQLCISNDGSTEPHVRPILDEWAATDNRIAVTHLARNEGIASASNHAAQLATGDFIALLDHDDELPPDALFEVARRLNEDPQLDVIYSDEDKLEAGGRRAEPFFKPGWSPDLLLSMNYLGHLTVLRRSLFEAIGGFRPDLDGSQDYDLVLRATERTARIAHIPKILYHWRKAPGSAATSITAKPFAHEAAGRALQDALARRNLAGTVHSFMPGRYMISYALRDTPTVSIIIPTRDRWELLQQCIESIESSTDYPRYEIIVIDNGSTEPGTLEYLDSIRDLCLVCSRPEPFNFARLNNFGAACSTGDYLLFLNNDTIVLREDWLTALLEQAQRPDVGAVGAKLLFPDSTIQHAGVVLGIGGVAGHAFKHIPANDPTYFDFADVIRNCSAVTAACMMVPRRVFQEIGGFDERLAVAFNDVDLCFRIRQRDYLIVYTPRALLRHLESASRKLLHPPADEQLMWRLWGGAIRAGDPYYNPNLTRSHEDWRLAL